MIPLVGVHLIDPWRQRMVAAKTDIEPALLVGVNLYQVIPYLYGVTENVLVIEGIGFYMDRDSASLGAKASGLYFNSVIIAVEICRTANSTCTVNQCCSVI